MKKQLKKNMAICLACITSVSLLAGCASSGSSTSSEQTDADTGNTSSSETVTITVAGWPSGDDGFKAALDGFHEKYPNIEVEFDFTDNASHHQKLNTELVSGTGAPDVAMINGGYMPQYVNSSALVNLLDEPYDAGQYADDFVTSEWQIGYSADGKRLVGIPWDIGACTLFYRTDIFEECGLPTDPEEVADLMSTWDGVLQVAEAVSIPNQRWFMPNAVDLYQLMFYDRDFFDENLELHVERDGDLECLAAVKTLRDNGYDMNTSMWSTEAYAGYAQGSVACVATGCWFGGFLKQDIDPDGAGHWASTRIPAGLPQCSGGGSFLVIPEQSEHKEEAWAFISYMLCTADAQNTMFEAIDYLPAYTPAWEDPLYQEEDAYFGGQVTKAFWTSLLSGIEPKYHTIMDVSANDVLDSSVNASLHEGLEPEAIRERLISDIQQATAESMDEQIQILKDAGVWNQ